MDNALLMCPVQARVGGPGMRGVSLAVRTDPESEGEHVSVHW